MAKSRKKFSERSKFMQILIILGASVFGLIVIAVVNNGRPHVGGNSISDAEANLIKKVLYKSYNESFEKDTGKPFVKSGWNYILDIEGSVSAKAILRGFNENEVRALQKYRGYWIISGNVSAVDGSFDGAIVSLGKRGSFNTFNAKFDDIKVAASFSKGQKVKIVCDGTSEAVSLVYGNNCNTYEKWVEGRINNMSRFPDKFLNRVENVEGKSSYTDLLTAISNLVEGSICFDDYYSKECTKDLNAS